MSKFINVSYEVLSDKVNSVKNGLINTDHIVTIENYSNHVLLNMIDGRVLQVNTPLENLKILIDKK